MWHDVTDYNSNFEPYYDQWNGTDWSGYGLDYGYYDPSWFTGTSDDYGYYDPSWFTGTEGYDWSTYGQEPEPIPREDLWVKFGPKESIAQAQNESGFVEDAVDWIGSQLKTPTGQAILTGISGILGKYLSSKDPKERSNLRSTMATTVARQGWNPEMVRRFLASLDKYENYMSQFPSTEVSPETQALRQQAISSLLSEGGTPGQLASRQLLSRIPGLAEQILAESPEAIAQEMERLHPQIGFSTHGKDVSEMVKDQRMANFAMKQGVAGMIQGVAGPMGETYMTPGNAQTLFGITELPKATQWQRQLSMLGPQQGRTSNIVSRFHYSTLPETQTQTGQLDPKKGTSPWLPALGDALSNLGKVFGSGAATQTQSDYDSLSKGLAAFAKAMGGGTA